MRKVNHLENLTQKGRHQANRLVPHLRPLGVSHIFSSPYARAVQTITPFARAVDLPIQKTEALKEREISKSVTPDFIDVVRKSWENFDFKLSGCESSRQCQTRVVDALNGIPDVHPVATVAVCSHGNAIALFLNYVDPSFGFLDWEALRNPDVKKVLRKNGDWSLDRSFEVKE